MPFETLDRLLLTTLTVVKRNIIDLIDLIEVLEVLEVFAPIRVNRINRNISL